MGNESGGVTRRRERGGERERERERGREREGGRVKRLRETQKREKS